MDKKITNKEIENRKAYHDYFVQEKLECGIVLKGNEVKSIRKGACNLKGAWITIQDGRLVLRGMHIARWDTSNLFDVNETRERELLAHKKEIRKLESKVQENGITLVPLKLYFKNGRCKVEVGICVGKKNYDKREVLKQKDIKREIERELKKER